MKLAFPSSLLFTVLAGASTKSAIHAFSPTKIGGRKNIAMRPTMLIQSLARGGALQSTSTSTSASIIEEVDQEASSVVVESPYEKLKTQLEAITHLSRASAVLSYDQQVFMPVSASAERGAQLAALATVLHDKKTNPQLLEWMDAIDMAQLDAKEQRWLELERKSFLENARVPSELAAKAAQLSARAYSEWVVAREAKDFSLFEDTLDECFKTSIAVASAKQGSSEKVYDFMLDEFEMGMSQERIDDIFAQVEDYLVPLIQKVLNSSNPPSNEALRGDFDIDAQQELSEKLVKAIGFNASEGRIDVSVHPFTSSMSPSDVRITSRFRTDEWYQGLAGSLHEGGHAIYEQSLPQSAMSIDTALSMGTHESQSLFWERHVGLSKAFWKYATPMVHEILPSLAQYSNEDLYAAINAVTDQSFIRVEADELSYPLHVILRYNIEKDVIGGNLKVTDIPSRWNADMKRYLNVDVPSDDKGCLQDVHWSYMAFGYFPTYLLGAIASAQLFHYCSKDIPDIEEKMEKGEFQTIKDWLTKKVHEHGRTYESLDALLNDQVGEALNPKYFLEYLETKYTDLYKL